MTVSLRKTDPDHIAASLIARLDDHYELVYVDRGDQLSDKQVDAIVSGDMESFWDDTMEWESDSRYHGALYVIRDAFDSLVREWCRADDTDYDLDCDDFERTDAFDTVRYAVEERDNADWVTDLARNTPRVLLRILAIDEDHAFAFQPVDPTDALARAGLPATDHNVRVMADTLAECSPEFSVLMGYWIVAADVADMYKLHRDVPLDITNPHLYLGNPFMGSGWISEDHFEGKVRILPDEVHTDQAAFGYPVTKVFGFGKYAPSQYEADITAAPTVSLSKSAA